MKTVFNCIILICGCPASYISSYRMIGNEISKDYYVINLKNDTVYVRVRAIKQYTYDKKTFLFFNFKNPYNKKVIVSSKSFGELKNELNDNQNYGVEIKNIKNIKKDTVYLNISDKIYKFYHD